MLGLCPHDMFTNTRMSVDLGECQKHHMEEMKAMFESDPEAAFYRRKWRGGLRVKLKGLVDIVDRTIASETNRLQTEAESAFKVPAEERKQLAYLKQDMSAKIALAEQTASDGDYA